MMKAWNPFVLGLLLFLALALPFGENWGSFNLVRAQVVLAIAACAWALAFVLRT